ncbi:UNVERIFIED_CONTAM: hypothetical protein Scaly_2663700 [Sesamum calycinum]|uniref:Uncharacterized protein n=1 Tax=Sesamum calycinum TaxID=2727403 RepID=A0AAW2JAP5_9LAMI
MPPGRGADRIGVSLGSHRPTVILKLPCLVEKKRTKVRSLAVLFSVANWDRSPARLDLDQSFEIPWGSEETIAENGGTDNIDVPAPADEAVGNPDPYKGYGKQGGHETKATTSSTAIRLSCFRTLKEALNERLVGKRRHESDPFIRISEFHQTQGTEKENQLEQKEQERGKAGLVVPEDRDEGKEQSEPVAVGYGAYWDGTYMYYRYSPKADRESGAKDQELEMRTGAESDG